MTSSYLVGLRLKALKARRWYRVLDRVERGIFDLASRLFDAVHSGTLLVELGKIICKLVDAGKSAFIRHVEAHGGKRALEVYNQGRRLGYRFSEGLLGEEFVRYLMFLDFNQPIGWGIYPRP